MSKKIGKKKGGVSSFYNNHGWGRRNTWWTFKDARQEIVSPYMGMYDATNLYNRIQIDLEHVIRAAVPKLKKDQDPDGVINGAMGDSFVRQLLPKHLVSDIYNLYNVKSTQHEYAVIDDTNRGKWNILSQVNDSSLKIVTNQNAISSYIFTSEICKALVKALLTNLSLDEKKSLMQMMKNSRAEQKDENEQDEGESDNNDSDGDSQPQDSGDGEGDNKDTESPSDKENGDGEESEGGDNSKAESPSTDSSKNKEGSSSEGGQAEDNGQSSNPDKSSGGDGKNNAKPNKTKFEELVSKALDSEFDKDLSDAKQKAFKRISDFEKTGLSLTDVEGSGAGTNVFEVVQLLDEIEEKAEEIGKCAPDLKAILQGIIDRSTSYFSKNYKKEDISIFESDEIDDLIGIENFHPLLERINLEEIETTNLKYMGKLNVYIDVSSSMNAEHRYGDVYVPNITFAKSLALKMMEMNMVDKIIPFGSSVHKPIEPLNRINILLLSANCGTRINNVVEDCERLQENGIIITDCDDLITSYSSKCFILGTPRARLRLGNDGKKFEGNKQVWKFADNGKEIVDL